ncbi:MAG: pyruvate formate lyase family protein [Armatimonadota bacterium]
MNAQLAPVTERIATLRADALRRDLVGELPDVRARIAQQALDATISQPQALRIAEVLDRVFHEVPVTIQHGELLVGCRGGNGYPEVDFACARGSAEYPYMIADFPILLEQGMHGVIARAEARLVGLDEANPEQMESVHFLRSVITSCRGVVAWAERYAQEAEAQAEKEADPQRKYELLEIAARCRRVPVEPATSFTDALQSVWFLYVALYLEAPATSCLGRLDQYLFPFYQRDLASGHITREQTKEWLCCLWVKLYENVLGVIGSHAQTITLGGQLPDGSSGVNDLSFLCIETAAAMGNVGAQIAVRWFAGQEPALLAEAFRLIEHGAVMPQMFNDHVYIDALARLGVPFTDAAQFSLFGCHEPVISGMGYQRPASWPGYVSFYDWVEQALGVESYNTPPQLRVIGDPPATAEELWERWLAAMRQGVRRAVIAANYDDKMKRELLPRPLMSAFLRDCIDNAADLTMGGARYNMTGFQGCGFATGVDAFLTVKEMVFERQLVSMPDLITALQADYQNHEELRQLLHSQGHKYGRDEEEADCWAVRMFEAYCDEVSSHRNLRGGPFTPGLWSFLQNAIMGRRTAASPNGRHAGELLSHSMDPCSGQAKCGPTAVLASAMKLDQRRLNNGGSMLIEFAPSVFDNPETRAKAQALCEGYFRAGGIELQLSRSTVEQLEEARRHPEQYADLVVRVAGYSDFFVRLDPLLQEYVIGREKHAVS